MFTLSNLPKSVLKQSRRIGRGMGSSKGKNAGHGHKGQIKRNGGKRLHVGFEGGQASLIKRIPKYRGYNNTGKRNWDLSILTTGVIARYFDNGSMINQITLLEKGLIGNKINRIRIIKNGEADNKKYTFGEEVYLTKGAQEVLIQA